VQDSDGNPFALPYYFSVDNNLVTNKRAMLKIRVFNWQPEDQQFTVALNLYHALFIPYLEILSSSIWVDVYNAERQTRGTNHTHGVIVTETQSDGMTLPYNLPDW
jgi:Iap family predicted aminopeptidase